MSALFSKRRKSSSMSEDNEIRLVIIDDQFNESIEEEEARTKFIKHSWLIDSYQEGYVLSWSDYVYAKR